MVSVAAASAPETNTALRPIRNLREPARRRALPIRGDIGNSASRLMTRMRDYFRVEAGTGTQEPTTFCGRDVSPRALHHRSPRTPALNQPDPPPVDLVRPGVV